MVTRRRWSRLASHHHRKRGWLAAVKAGKAFAGCGAGRLRKVMPLEDYDRSRSPAAQETTLQFADRGIHQLAKPMNRSRRVGFRVLLVRLAIGGRNATSPSA
jgi:hypothetical protein